MQHTLTDCCARLAEAAGDHARAAMIYEEAAGRWREFGNVPEHAYALLARGRCLFALDDPHADVPLREARQLFASMGFKPALAETDMLLAQAAPASTS